MARIFGHDRTPPPAHHHPPPRDRLRLRRRATASTDTAAGPVCGDGTCHDGAGENKDNCPADCAPSGPVCGNGQCEDGESAETCTADCKPAGPVCGNGQCESGESNGSCPADCKPAGPVCGDGKCDATETTVDCPADCPGSAESCVGKCGQYTQGAACQCDKDCDQYNDCCADLAKVCGVGPVCTPACTGKACGADGCGGICGTCSAGNVCSATDQCVSNGPICGNGTCESGETTSNCPADCKTGCFGDFSLGSGFYKSQDTSQLGQLCDNKSLPKNCPDGSWINFSDDGTCLCTLSCAAIGVKVGQNCTTSGNYTCQKIKATNAGANGGEFCVTEKWQLCTE